MITGHGNLIPDRLSAEGLIHVMALRSILIFALAAGLNRPLSAIGAFYPDPNILRIL